jgi:hypothetical protein
MGLPGRVKRALTKREKLDIQYASEHYTHNIELFRNSLRPDQRFLNNSIRNT